MYVWSQNGEDTEEAIAKHTYLSNFGYRVAKVTKSLFLWKSAQKGKKTRILNINWSVETKQWGGYIFY